MLIWIQALFFTSLSAGRTTTDLPSRTTCQSTVQEGTFGDPSAHHTLRFGPKGSQKTVEIIGFRHGPLEALNITEAVFEGLKLAKAGQASAAKEKIGEMLKRCEAMTPVLRKMRQRVCLAKRQNRIAVLGTEDVPEMVDYWSAHYRKLKPEVVRLTGMVGSPPEVLDDILACALPNRHFSEKCGLRERAMEDATLRAHTANLVTEHAKLMARIDTADYRAKIDDAAWSMFASEAQKLGRGERIDLAALERRLRPRLTESQLREMIESQRLYSSMRFEENEKRSLAMARASIAEPESQILLVGLAHADQIKDALLKWCNEGGRSPLTRESDASR